MKISKALLIVIAVLFAASSLFAGEFILYGGSQKPGKLTWSGATSVPEDLLDGQYGSTVGVRFSAGRVVGFEQNISFSPRFAKPGVRALQTDSNLLIQAPGRVVPYLTAGIGYIRTWGAAMPTDLDPAKIAAFAFSFGNKFAVNYGGGIKVRKLLGPVGLNVDVRGYTVFDVYSEKLNIIQTSAGLVFNW